MKRLSSFSVAAIAAVLSLPCLGNEPGAAKVNENSDKASIPFAHLGGIRDWRADGNDALYVQGRNKQWYRAELFGPCMDLSFADRVGFVVEPTGAFDRFSSIVVRGRECRLRSLTESEAPPAREKKNAAAKTAVGNKKVSEAD